MTAANAATLTSNPKFMKANIMMLFLSIGAFAQMTTADFEKSLDLLWGSDQGKAMADLEAAEQKYPNTDKVLYMRAIYQYRDGDINGALMSQSNALKANPKFALAYDGRAALFSSKGMYDKAIADQTRAIGLEPANVSFLINRIKYYQSNNQFKEALEDAIARIKLQPGSYYAYLDAAVISKKMDPNYDADSFFIQSYAVKDSQKYVTDVLFGQFMIGQGRFREAVSKYESGIAAGEKYFEAEDFHNMAVAYYKTQNYDKAIYYYNKAITMAPGNIDYLDNLAAVYNTQENYEMLKQTARLALAANSSDPWANKYMAIALFNTGQESLANEYNEKALKLAAEQNK